MCIESLCDLKVLARLRLSCSRLKVLALGYRLITLSGEISEPVLAGLDVWLRFNDH